MNELLLSVHVVTAIVFIGSITLAASLFPRYASQALGLNGPVAVGEPVASLLHRITRVYTVLALAVPMIGIVLAARMRVLTETWVIVSIIVTAAAAVILAALIAPAQNRIMATIDQAEAPIAGTAAAESVGSALRQLSMTSGLFSLLWVVVVVLMIVRPGSTAGV